MLSFHRHWILHPVQTPMSLHGASSVWHCEILKEEGLASSLSALACKYWWALVVVGISCGGIIGIATGIVIVWHWHCRCNCCQQWWGLDIVTLINVGHGCGDCIDSSSLWYHAGLAGHVILLLHCAGTRPAMSPRHCCSGTVLALASHVGLLSPCHCHCGRTTMALASCVVWLSVLWYCVMVMVVKAGRDSG